jgi:hypothetical protein
MDKKKLHAENCMEGEGNMQIETEKLILWNFTVHNAVHKECYYNFKKIKLSFLEIEII